MSDSDQQELQHLRDERLAAATDEIKRLHDLVEKLGRQLDESLKANEDLRKLLADLQTKLDTLVVQQKKRNRKDYGKKTERYNPRPALSNDKVDAVRTRNDSRLAKIKSLPIKDIPHVVTPDERTCDECGSEKIKIGEDITYQLDRIASTMRRLRHLQEILACPKCKGKVSVAPKPQPPFPKCFASSGLLSDVIVSRYADFTPAYRLERIYGRQGAPIPRSTLCDWILAASLTLKPLYDLMINRVFLSKVIGTDDTEVKIQKRKTDKNIAKGKMTPYMGDKNNPYNIFDFSPDQTFARNKKMFEGFKGFVQCDAAIGFDAIFENGNCIEVGCNAHARRKIFDCLVVAPAKAEEILKIYKDIYAVEARAIQSAVPPDELLAMRQTVSAPLFQDLQVKLLEIKTTEMPKSPITLAVNYILGHWDALTRYLNDPDLVIDNNRTERTVKDFVLYRKNAMFVGSNAGGQAAAICMSIISSAKRNGVEPWAYLKDIFDRINTARTSELEQFLPDIWLQSQSANS